jgi:hypothetical protein
VECGLVDATLKGLAAVPAFRLKPEDLRLNAGLRFIGRSPTALAEVLPAESDRKAALAAFIGWIDATRKTPIRSRLRRHARARDRTVAGGTIRRSSRRSIAARAAGAASLRGALVQRRATVEAALVGVDRTAPAGPLAALAAHLMGHYFGWRPPTIFAIGRRSTGRRGLNRCAPA